MVMFHQNVFSPFSPKMLLFSKKLLKWKNIENLISHKRGFNHFRRQMSHSPQKRLRPQKRFFTVFLEKYSFFWKKLLNNKIFNTAFAIKKSYVNFCRNTPPFPKKLLTPPSTLTSTVRNIALLAHFLRQRLFPLSALRETCNISGCRDQKTRFPLKFPLR